MTTTDEPRPVGESLAGLRDRLERTRLRGPVIDEPDELTSVVIERRHREARWTAAVPRRFRQAVYADFAPDIATQLAAWGDGAMGEMGDNLVIFGPVGVGKSHAACCAVRAASDAGLKVRFWPAGELLDQLRPGGPESAFAVLTGFDVLIVDDLGQERATEWTGERVDLLVNRRWLDQKPTVVTTNLEPPALAAHIGERAYSRLVGEAVVLRMTGDDRRRHPVES